MSQRERLSDCQAVPMCTSTAFFMPLSDRAQMDDQLRISRTGVSLSGAVDKKDFPYDLLFTSRDDFLRDAYAQLVAPLVRAACEGETAMALLAGVQNVRLNAYLFSSGAGDNAPGLVVQAAQALLGAAQGGVVRFSWFKIDNSPGEGLTDLLRAASAQSAPNNTAPERALALREAGAARAGRGLAVQNLLEVELSRAADVEQIVAQVLKCIPHVADHAVGLSHTVWQLSLSPHGTQSTQGTAQGDPPGLGRVSFVLLSQPSLPVSAVVGASAQQYNWAETLPLCVPQSNTAQTNSSASQPFHKSRLLLFIKDAMLRRQRCAVLHFLQASVEQRSANAQWLRIVDLLCRNRETERDRDGERERVKSTLRRANSHSQLIELQRETPRERDRPRSATPQPQRSHNTLSQPVQTPQSAVAQTQRRTQRAHTQDKPHTHTQSPPPQPPGAQSDSDPLGYDDDEDEMQELIDNTHPVPGSFEDSCFGESPQPRVAPPLVRSQSNGRLARPPLAASTSSRQNNNISSAVGAAAPAAQSSVNITMSHSTTHVSGKRGRVNSIETVYTEDTVHHESEAALSLALEASRSEAAALRVAYNYANDRFTETKSAYDALLAQLKEEGAMLTQRDRERYKSAMKDLKDYEIYKEVMEAAMLRLQSELESFARENKELRSARDHEERSSQKHKSVADRHSKDLVMSRKRLEELEERVKVLEKQNKQLTREKDSAAASLAHAQTQALQRTSQLQETNALRLREIDDLQKKLKFAEERARQLDVDRENILAANAAEVTSLRAAHSKALETLLSYQNENDQLRARAMDRDDDDTHYDTLAELDRNVDSEDDATLDDRRERSHAVPPRTHTALSHNTAAASHTVRGMTRTPSNASLTNPQPPYNVVTQLQQQQPQQSSSRDRVRKVEELVAAKRSSSAPRGATQPMPTAVAQIVQRQPGVALQRVPPQPPARHATPARSAGK